MGVLHVFDLDGTLLPGTTASLQLARVHGGVEKLAALEASFAAREIGTREFAVAAHALWRDLTPATVEAAFTSSPWLAGIPEVCADIHARGERCVVVTLSPDFFAAHLPGLGFDEVVASRFPPVPFTQPVDPAGILTPEDKIHAVERVRTRHAIPLSRCVAYGDSMSDAPLFGHLDHTVAVNADRNLDGLAARHYRGGDLTGAYALARTLLER